MLIKAITLENFKGIRDQVRIDLKPITLLFGPNSSGKSTIIQALHYAREIFERQNLDPGRTMLGGSAFDLGGFESIVHGHDLSLPIIMRFDLDLRKEDLPRYYQGYEERGRAEWEEAEIWDAPNRVETAWVEIHIKWSSLLDRPVVSKYSVGANDMVFATIETSDDARQVYISWINPINPIFLQGISYEEAIEIFENMLTASSLEEVGAERLGPMVPLLWGSVFTFEGGIPGFNKTLGLGGQRSALPRWQYPLQLDRELFADDMEFLDEGNFVMTLSSLIVGPGEILRNELRKINYLGPIRDIPPRNFTPTRSPDESRWASGIAAWEVLYTSNSGLLYELNSWLGSEDHLNSGYTVKLKEYLELEVSDPLLLALYDDRALNEEDVEEAIQDLSIKKRLLLREEDSRIEVLPQDVGVGISQVVPVLVLALHKNDGIAAIEQPELHIHPAFQVALGDLFISESADKDVCFLLETHSEHLLLRLLRRIRETHEDELPPDVQGLAPESLAIYYITKTNQGVSISELQVSEDGDSKGRWPEGFFEERHEELY